MSFQLIPPNGTIEIADANFRNLNININKGSWNTLGTGSGLTVSGTGLSTQAYYRSTLEGLTFFNISFTVTSGNITWSLPSRNYILLPKLLQQLGASGTGNFPFTNIPISLPGNGTVSGYLTIINSGKNGVLINNTGATIAITAPYISLQGFYFTDK